MPDLLDELVAAWREWDRKALMTSRLRRPPNHWLKVEVVRKADAIAALGLDSNRLHDRVAELRQGDADVERAVRQAAAEQGVGE